MDESGVLSEEEEGKLRLAQVRARNGRALSPQEVEAFIEACRLEVVRAQTTLACLDMAMGGKIDADMRDGEIVFQVPSVSAGE